MRRIWLDIETTGLDMEKDVILEVGIVLADTFDVRARASWLVTPTLQDLSNLRPRVREMHTKNGLLEEVMEPDTLPLYAVENQIIEWLKDNMPPEDSWKLAGSSIHFDRACIAKYMPKFENRLHYRMLDVSSIKESLMDWAPDLVEARPDAKALHRAVPDCLDSLEEWQYYKTVLLGDF